MIKFAEHAVNITPCAGSPTDSQVQLTTTVENYSTSNLNYSWTVNGRPVNNTGRT